MNGGHMRLLYHCVIAAIFSMVSAGCGGGSEFTTAAPSTHGVNKVRQSSVLQHAHDYRIKLTDGRSGFITASQGVVLKTMRDGTNYFSFRGKGFEHLYRSSAIVSLFDGKDGVDLVQSHSIVPNVCSPVLGCGGGPCYDGDSCPPLLPRWVDLVAVGCDPNFSQCGDDGAGVGSGNGLVIKLPGQYYCYWDFSTDIPDCYKDPRVNGPFQQGRDLFKSWMRQNGSVGILCDFTGVNGKAYAFYVDDKGAGAAAKNFQAASLTAFFFPKDWYTSVSPGPMATINVNFFQYGIPIDAYNVGYCDHSG